MVARDFSAMTQEQKVKFMNELCVTKGYAMGLRDLLKMVVHMKGGDNNASITIGELADLAEIAIESQPLYQEYKKENPEAFKD